MEDFASASMLRLLLRAMAAEGMQPPLPEPGGARVPRQHKQQVVEAVMRAGGPALLLRLAQQVRHIEGEPLHRALVGARDPHDFHARWQRLERYVHARHQVLLRESTAQSMLLEHVARNAADPRPLAAESLAVLGAWIGALQAIGTPGLQVELAGRLVHGAPAAQAVPDAAAAGAWRLRWAAVPVRGLAAAGSGPDAPAAAALIEGLPWGEPARTLAHWLVRDPSGTVRAGEAAAALGLPLRTLQRRLAGAGLSFSALAGEVRVRLAAAYLARTGHELAEIGFLCGYADQPHFTRDFTRRAGLPPARYRSAAQPPVRKDRVNPG
jgi:AraC-like DNA-binding protein